MSQKVATWKSEGEGMRFIGLAFAVIGFIAFLSGFESQTTVATTSILSGSTESVYNLGALQQQMIIVHTGLSMFVAGTLLYGIGVLVQQIARLRESAESKTNSLSSSDQVEVADQ